MRGPAMSARALESPGHPPQLLTARMRATDKGDRIGVEPANLIHDGVDIDGCLCFSRISGHDACDGEAGMRVACDVTL